MLVGRTVGQSELLEIFFRRPGAWAQHDKGVRHLPFHFMIERHDERLVHGRMAFEQRLGLYREDVLAAAYGPIVVVPDEVVETLLLAPANVAGVIPTLPQAVGC